MSACIFYHAAGNKFDQYKMMQKPEKNTESLAHGYSSESTCIPLELSNEYQHERVWMSFKNRCIFMPWTKVASALEGLMDDSDHTIGLGIYVFQFKSLQVIDLISVFNGYKNCQYPISETFLLIFWLK